MAFTNETRNYGLPDWIGPDKPTWLVDMNNAFETIDNQMKANETAAMQAKQIGESAMDTAGNAVEATHTNAAAITALTASLAETDTRVDGLTPPAETTIVTHGDITGFGNENLYAIYVNARTVLYILGVTASTILKTNMIDPPPDKGLPSTVSKVFPGKISLFDNSADLKVGTELCRFLAADLSAPGAVTVIVYRGVDGYYYTMTDPNYKNMSENRYAATVNIISFPPGTSWPTT